MWLKFVFAAIIVVECLLCLYIPTFVKKNMIKKKKNKFINLENFENIASGALLALALIHLLPETVIISQKTGIDVYKVFIIILSATTFLNVTDIFYETGLHSDISNDVNGDMQLYEKRELEDIETGHSKQNNDLSQQKTQELYDIEKKTSEETTKKIKKKTLFLLELIKSNAFFITIGLVIHSFVEGMLLGALNDTSTIIVVASSYIAHKWAESLIIYKSVVCKTQNQYISIIYSWSFILALPVGLIITILYFPSNDIVEMIFTAIACGFFIYLSFNITKDVSITENNKNYIAGSYFIGITAMASLMLVLNYLEDQVST